MRFPQTYVQQNYASTGVQGITGAAPQTVVGKTIDSGLAGTVLCARVYAKATTSSLALTARWQVLDNDGATWVDVIDSNNPANVALITGTGSAASVVKYISAPTAVVAGSRQARLVVASSGATGGGAGTDECSIAYDFRAPAGILAG